MPKVSIILPVYNCAQFISTCLESIIAQSFTEWECIIVNDGSTDDTERICKYYADRDSRFIIAQQTNQGAPTARNAGLEIARGKYIGFLDSDDFIHPEMYHILVDQIDKTGADLVLCEYTRSEQQKISFSTLSRDLDTHFFNREQIFKYWFQQSNNLDMWVVWNKLYKREIIANERFANITLGEDQDFNFRIYLKCKLAVMINATLYNWHLRNGSVTRKNGAPIPVQSRFQNLQKLVEFQNYSDRMTIREQGYYYSRVMKNILYCRDVANDHTLIKTSLKKLYRQFMKKYFLNMTISPLEKTAIILFYSFPLVFHKYAN